jgi:hypothetical protein
MTRRRNNVGGSFLDREGRRVRPQLVKGKLEEESSAAVVLAAGEKCHRTLRFRWVCRNVGYRVDVEALGRATGGVRGLDGVKTARKGEARLERHQRRTGRRKFLRLCSTCFAAKEKRTRGASAYWHPHGRPSVPSRMRVGRAARARDGVWPCRANCQAAAVLLGAAYGA